MNNLNFTQESTLLSPNSYIGISHSPVSLDNLQPEQNKYPTQLANSYEIADLPKTEILDIQTQYLSNTVIPIAQLSSQRFAQSSLHSLAKENPANVIQPSELLSQNYGWENWQINRTIAANYRDFLSRVRDQTENIKSLLQNLNFGDNSLFLETILGFISPPTLTADLVEDTGFNATDKITSNPEITGTLTDINGIGKFQAKFSQAATFVDILSELNADGSFILTRDKLAEINGGELPNGDYELNLQAADTFGNISQLVVQFTLDSTAITLPPSPAFIELRRDVIINADLWTEQPEMLAAGYGFEGIIGIPQLMGEDNIDRAIAAGAGVNLDYVGQDPAVPLRNITSAASPIGIYGAGFGPGALFYDAMPIEFSWPLLPSTVDPTDIQITLNTGEKVNPNLAALNPNYDYNERHVIVVFGEFGNRIKPGEPGAIYPVSVEIVADDTPLQAVGPNGPVNIVGLNSPSSNPYVSGPQIIGARLTETSLAGDYAPVTLSGNTPNHGIELYGDAAEYRLRIFTSGGFSPDGVSGFLPTEYAKYFRIQAVDDQGNQVVIEQDGVVYDLGVGQIEVIGLAELGIKADTYDEYYQEDHDNYFDIIIQGDKAAVQLIQSVEIPGVAPYSPIYNPGGPGRTPVEETIYTEPAAPQIFPVTVSLDDLGTVSYAAQSVTDYDAADDLPVLFRFLNPVTGAQFLTDSSIEGQQALANGYIGQGVPTAVNSNDSFTVPVYRFFNPENGDYLYTTSESERSSLQENPGSYEDQGEVFTVYDHPFLGLSPVYRAFNSTTGLHLYTQSEDELNQIIANDGYVSQGIAWYSPRLL